MPGSFSGLTDDSIDRSTHPPEALHAREVVECNVEVLQLLQVVQIAEPFDDVVLQVQDLELATRGAEHLRMLKVG